MYFAPLAEMDFAQARRSIDDHLWLTLQVAREAAGKVRPRRLRAGTGAGALAQMTLRSRASAASVPPFDGLAEQVLLEADRLTGGCGGHASSGVTWANVASPLRFAPGAPRVRAPVSMDR